MGAETGPNSIVSRQVIADTTGTDITGSNNGSKTGLDTVLMRESTQVDDTGTFVYVGYSKRNTATSAGAWFIERYTKATGVRLLASEKYDQVWDNRASLTYL